MENKSIQVENLPVIKLHPFEGHPFQVKDNEEMEHLAESIKERGILTPLVVRSLPNGEYEVISGHRRLHACKKAGVNTVPAFVCSMDRDKAAIALVDSNLHREHILPSEKAFAYKLKMEAMSHQGTSGQPGQKWTRDEIAEKSSDSARQVQRYIRLTKLQTELLQMVDEGRIALTPAVELSYLREEEQKALINAMGAEDCTPSLSQAVKMRKLSQSGVLQPERIEKIMAEPKANQKERISIDYSQVREYFPQNMSPFRVKNEILRLIKENFIKQRKNRGGR